MLVLDMGLIVAIVMTDHEVSTQQLVGIGAAVLLFSEVALVARVGLGDMARLTWLRYTGPGYRDPERRRYAQHLGLRSLVLFGVFAILLLVAPPVVRAMLGHPASDWRAASAHVDAGRAVQSTRLDTANLDATVTAGQVSAQATPRGHVGRQLDNCSVRSGDRGSGRGRRC